MMKVKQVYQMPQIDEMQVCLSNVCSTSFDAGSQNERFGGNDGFNDMNW